MFPACKGPPNPPVSVFWPIRETQGRNGGAPCPEAKQDTVAELVQDTFGDILKQGGKKEKKRNAKAVEVLEAQAAFCREAEGMVSCHCREDKCPWKQQKADAMRTREFVLRSLAPRFERHDLTDTEPRRARPEQQGAGSVQREGGPAGRKRFLNVGTLSKDKFTRLRKGATEAGGDVLRAALGGLRNSGPYAREKPRGRPSWARREAGMAAKIRTEWLKHCRTSSGKRRGGKSVLVLTGLLTQVIEEIRAEVNKDRAPGVRPVSRYAVQINRPAGIRTWRRKTDMCHICINGTQQGPSAGKGGRERTEPAVKPARGPQTDDSLCFWSAQETQGRNGVAAGRSSVDSPCLQTTRRAFDSHLLQP